MARYLTFRQPAQVLLGQPMLPQKLEAALEIREGRDVMVEKLPDLVGDELPTTRVLLFPLIYETC